MYYYLLAWQRYFDFTGRSSRTEFWLFFLVHCGITTLLIVSDLMLVAVGWADMIYSVITFIPMLSAMVRRLHDSDRSGWWITVFIVPLIGPCWLIYLLCLVESGSRTFNAEGEV
jgi:uncharacterized membrane protein YhaH (DUF805 family)